MSDYVKFRKVENVVITYDGPTYLSMRTGDKMSATYYDFQDGILGLINVSCKLTLLDGTIKTITNETAFDFNTDYGDVIRYKDSEDNIKSFYDGEILEEIRVDGNYLKITPVLVCEVNDYGQERVKLIVGQSPTPQVFSTPSELYGDVEIPDDIGGTIQYNLATFPEGDGYTLSDPHYFIFKASTNIYFLIKTNDLGNDIGEAYVENAIMTTTGYREESWFGGKYEYNGEVLNFYSNSAQDYGFTLTFAEQVFISLNDIYIRVDGVERAEIRHNFSLTNPFSIEDRFSPNDIEVKVIYTDDTNGRILNYSLGEYTLISGVNHLIFGSEPTSSGIFLVQVNVGKFYDGSGDKDISSNVSEIPVMELDPHAIELFTYKPIYYFGERFNRIVVSCYALYKITESINYRALIGGSSYSLNVANGTQLFQNTLLVATLVSSEYGTLTSELTLLVGVNSRQELLVYDKITGEEKNFGGINISSGFNIAYNLDGTLDSCSIQVFNGEDYALETNTLCKMTFNNSWWVVKSDKKEYVNSETSNKWKHTIELLDPRHLLKSRSLVSCGFNKDRYTYQTFLDRLISLSNFKEATVSLGNVFNPNNKVRVIKSFDNYTLGKALEEFGNSENAIHKVDYIDEQTPYIYFLSKSGNNNPIIDLDTDAKHKVASYVNEEMGNKDFASKVISNIENAISSVPQRYPLTGGKFLDSDAFELTKDNAYFKMPSKAFKVNKLIVVPKIQIARVQYLVGGTRLASFTKEFYPYSQDQILTEITNAFGVDIEGEITDEEMAIEIHNIARGELSIDKQENKLSNIGGTTHPMLISQNMSGQYDQQYWYFKFKEGDDKITNFVCLDFVNNLGSSKGTKLSSVRDEIFTFNFVSGDVPNPSGFSQLGAHECARKTNNISDVIVVYTQFLTPKDTKFAVEYIPQADMVMEYDNGTMTKDIALFNQTGKFIDNFAVSKLVKSYATDISGNTHNYYTYYDKFFDILEVGRKVYKTINGKRELMVISTVSIDYINGEKYAVMYALSKYSAVKSLMFSADSQIRDYDTPQRNNVVRKQNYKDYIELTFETAVQDLDTPYCDIIAVKDLLALETKKKGSQVDYVAFIGINKGESGVERYYQMPTFAVYYDSSVSVITDFGDNNIIGYDKANLGTTMNWKISDWNTFFGVETRYNVPIDYTASSGDFGEVKDIEVILANKTTIDVAFLDYKNIPALGLSTLENSYSITEVAPLSFKDFHNLLATMPFVRPHIKLREEHYNKDGLETPFFQYTFQIGSTEDIRVGSHILVNHGIKANEVYLYQFHFREDAKPDNNNFQNVEFASVDSTEITLNNVCIFNINALTREMQIKFYSYATFDLATGGISNFRNYKLDGTLKNKCFEIVSARCRNGTMSESELIMAIDNCSNELTAESELRININIYRR